jgi:hypothetical protein
MIIAALLFAIGTMNGCNRQIVSLILNSILILLGFTAIWWVKNSIDHLKIAILIGYLSAYKAGYLVGAYSCKSSDCD